MKAPVLIKLSGELLALNGSFGEYIEEIARQIALLIKTTPVAVVIGGGNIFRGNQHAKLFNIDTTTGHSIGMLATTINALLLRDIFKRHGISSSILTAFECSLINTSVNQEDITNAFIKGNCIIFAGGIGSPFVTTDTAAMIRGLQCKAEEVWKITKVDGIYEDDPHKNPYAKRYHRISYTEALEKKLRILDVTALNLAQENKVRVRVFSMFEKDSILQAYANPTYESILTDL
jgi:uridylate kinase